MLRMDRGRIVTAMDSELLRLCEPLPRAEMRLHADAPAALGTNIFWTWPVMAAPSEVNGILMRTATIRLFFFPEVA